MRGDSNIEIPLLTKKRNRQSSRVEEGKTGLFLSCGGKLSIPLKWAQISWEVSGVSERVSSSLSSSKREREISWETLQHKKASSRVDGRISWFLWNCGGKLRVPLELCGDLRDPLMFPQGSQICIRVARGTSGFVSHHCMNE